MCDTISKRNKLYFKMLVFSYNNSQKFTFQENSATQESALDGL